ncbi:GNAT family N-acetyltransferase [Photobacterium sp. 1_MG-2023]|uniref:GNAT family N-acetyltransferase n=1 Tax=Photobacterium sp. 1_MG-2023 TaxID=3062646 RepID=UPI0026E1F011|nr:GNAT family N-acetyltransferase [Photobacterium sp. 1_MG-2023]MDO6705916.1 GNAT family N-acetyltransferase [Photobacterium sp. 1_MG-2023]
MRQPLLTTERLLLRPLQLADAPRIQKLAGAPEIALGTTNIPYPYDSGMAGQWIGRALAGWEQGTLAIFAMTLRDTEQLIGCIGLHHIDNQTAQLGFWLGVPFWHQGYCSEAACCVVHYGFSSLKLRKIFGQHRRLDPKPGKVLERAGLKFVRIKEKAIRVNRITEDLSYYEAAAPQFAEV